MLENLFKNNKLEYIYIKTFKYKSIVKIMTISFNIEKLRYFNVDVVDNRVEIALDVS